MQIINAEQYIPIILQKIKAIIQYYQDNDLHILELQCYLLNALITISVEFTLSQEDTFFIVRNITDVFIEENYFFYNDYFWELLNLVIEKTNWLQTELGEKWVFLALQHFNNNELLSSTIGIAKTFSKIIHTFSQKIIEQFALGAIDIIRNNVTELKDIVEITAFYQHILQILQKRNSLNEEFVDFYNQILQKMNCY